MKCVKCHKEEKIHCRKHCRSCYEKMRWEKLKENPTEHRKILERSKKLRDSRLGKISPIEHRKSKNGSGTITVQGYKRIPIKNHPNSQKSGCILEHVWVMSNHLGRPLEKNETVHHKNGNRLDNRIENLELKASAHGPGQSVEDILMWCYEFIDKYEKEFPHIKEGLWLTKNLDTKAKLKEERLREKLA